MSKKPSVRRKSIFAFNSISPEIEEDELEEVKKLFRTYHKFWWCFKQLYAKQKKLDLAEKISSSFLVASGVVAGAATLNPIVMGVISGFGLIMKTLQEATNRGKKIEKAKFAFMTYEKTLLVLKNALRGGKFDRRKFLIEMETYDNIIIDFGLNQEKFEKDWGKLFGD